MVNNFKSFKVKNKFRYLLVFTTDKEYQINIELDKYLSKKDFINYVNDKKYIIW